MADGWMRDSVLAWADADANLHEKVRLVVLAAPGAPKDVAEVRGDDINPTQLLESLTTVDE